MKQKSLEMVQVTVPIFFYFDEISTLSSNGPKTAKNLDFDQFVK